MTPPGTVVKSPPAIRTTRPPPQQIDQLRTERHTMQLGSRHVLTPVTSALLVRATGPTRVLTKERTGQADGSERSDVFVNRNRFKSCAVVSTAMAQNSIYLECTSAAATRYHEPCNRQVPKKVSQAVCNTVAAKNSS